MKVMKKEIERISAFIQRNYLRASDSRMAERLEITQERVQKIRHRLGLIRTPEQVASLKFVKIKTKKLKDWHGVTNAFGDPVDDDGVPIPV